MFKKVRPVFFWMHLIAGVVTSIIILSMCITGGFMSLELPVTKWSDSKLIDPATITQQTPSIEALASAYEKDGNAQPQSITIAREPTELAVVNIARKKQTWLNPHTGESLGDKPKEIRDLFHAVMGFHRWFSLEGAGRDVGKVITGTVALTFVLITLTGILIWLPRKWRWKAVRQVIWFRRGLKGKARDFNWHNVLGIWFVIPLCFIAFTGAAISYKWLNQATVVLAGGEAPKQNKGKRPPAPKQAPEKDDSVKEIEPWAAHLVGADSAVALVTQDMPDWSYVDVSTPKTATEPLKITVKEGNGRQVQLHVDYEVSREPLKITSKSDWFGASRSQQVRGLIRFGHTGEVAGGLGTILSLLAALAGAVLSVTGLMLSWRRFTRWKAKQDKLKQKATS